MKTYTSEDFKTFKKFNGTIFCPAGDYSKIKVFKADCRFSGNSKFGSNSEFGKNCSFGKNCNFGKNCSFGESCSFGSNCSFREGCSFGERNSFRQNCDFARNSEFGRSCNFGKWNNFGSNCEFGKKCSFGEWCIFNGICDFKENCEFENSGVAKTTTPFIAMSGGSANRTSYAFNLENGIFVRSGCFFGTLKQFEDAVILTHGDNIHGKTYLMWVEIIKINFGEA